VTKQLYGLACCALLLSPITSVANAQQTAAVPTPVIVTNAPAVNVLNTPSVNIANTPTVRVTNNASPLYTLNADELNSFQLAGSFNGPTGVNFTPPPNKVMVLDYVGFFYVGPSVPIFGLGCDLADTTASLLFAVPPQKNPDIADVNVLSVAQPVRLLGNISCSVSAYRGFIGRVDYSVVGHYVNR
jgi:hypothetical protein